MSNTRKKGTCIRGLPQFTICDWDNLLGCAFLFFVMPSLPPDRQTDHTQRVRTGKGFYRHITYLQSLVSCSFLVAFVAAV